MMSMWSMSSRDLPEKLLNPSKYPRFEKARSRLCEALGFSKPRASSVMRRELPYKLIQSLKFRSGSSKQESKSP